MSAGTFTVSVLFAATSSGAANLEAHASSASAYCAGMPASKVSAIVGWSVTLSDELVHGSTLVCLYQGSAGTVTLEKETGIVASTIATRSKAEAAHKKLFYASQPHPLPAGTTISFTAATALGPLAFYWNGVIGAMPYSGADDYQGTTGYFAEMSSALQSSRMAKLEQLALAG